MAVKKLHITAAEAGHRELAMAETLAKRDFLHVLPVLDYGQDANSDGYFIVMPVAKRSLATYLREQGPRPDPEAATILLEIARGLEEVNDLVHRDLKPGNILEYEGRWVIADFGIARFAEAATSARTLKGALSALYAAPEQWRGERASHATDLYSLGCVAHALLTGSPPFEGGDREALQKKHLEANPPDLPQADPRLRQLIRMLLRKRAEARPSRQRVLEILGETTKERATASLPPASRLAGVGAALADEAAKAEAARASANRLVARRREMAKWAMKEAEGLIDRLFEKIIAEAPVAEASKPLGGRGRYLQLGPAALHVQKFPIAGALEPGMFGKWDDVVTGFQLSVAQSQPPYEWGASFWYGRQEGADDYRWYEVGYMVSPLLGRELKSEPFALPPGEAAQAGPMAEYQRAYNPVAVDDEQEDDFKARWAGLLAEAVQGRLQTPRTLPLRDNWWKG